MSGDASHAVFTFSSENADLPPNERAIARIKMPMPTGSGKTRAVRMSWHPVIFYAASTSEAHDKAEAWWERELARERQKVENAAKRVEARKAKAMAQ